MKRILLGFVLIVLLLLVAGVLGTSFFMGSIIKKGVETAGPLITKVNVKLEGARLAMLSGNGELRGLVVGNPEGYKTPSAIQVGTMAVDIVPRSVFSDKVIVRSIRVLSPEVTFEGGLGGNNLSKLLENIRGPAAKGGNGSASSTSSASRKIEVDDLLVSGGKINLSVGLLGGVAAAVPLPEIHLANLGQGPEGITAADLSERLLKAILENATKAVANQVGSLSSGLTGATQGAGTGTVQQVEKAAKGLGDLFKRK